MFYVEPVVMGHEIATLMAIYLANGGVRLDKFVQTFLTLWSVSCLILLLTLEESINSRVNLSTAKTLLESFVCCL